MHGHLCTCMRVHRPVCDQVIVHMCVCVCIRVCVRVMLRPSGFEQLHMYTSMFLCVRAVFTSCDLNESVCVCVCVCVCVRVCIQ